MDTFVFVSPTYWPCKAVPLVMTTFSVGRRPRFLNSVPNLFATVVFPVPGGPVKTI